MLRHAQAALLTHALATAARGTGATARAVTVVLLAIAPVTGLGRVVTAVPGVADGLGYDIEAALEDPDDL